MPTSQAHIDANRQNALQSKGPKTEAGKSRSRGNALKHGLAGDGVVLPESDAAEVEALAASLAREMKPTCKIEAILVRRLAVEAVRMDRCASQEMAAVAENVRVAVEAFEAPEGATEEEAEILRVEAGHIALFDPSDEATRARKYEAAAERGFFRALREFRQHRRDTARTAVTDLAPPLPEPEKETRASQSEFESLLAETNPIPNNRPPAPAPVWVPAPTLDLAPVPHFDIPFAIGRSR